VFVNFFFYSIHATHETTRLDATFHERSFHSLYQCARYKYALDELLRQQANKYGTRSLVQSPAWKADSYWAGHEIPPFI
jgi:hypothetical protein